jgi:hypothetical protein
VFLETADYILYLFCIILSVLGAMQLTDRLALTSSLQTAMENLPKLARITFRTRPSGQERLRVEPSQAYEVDGERAEMRR